MSNYTTIVKTVHGSHLYGLNTPTSDLDQKQVFVINDIRDVILGRGREATREQNEKLDLESMSLHKFFEGLSRGEMIAVDIIHTPEEFILEKDPVWNEIRTMRDQFYTKGMKSYMGYIKSQYFGFKQRVENLATLNRIKSILEASDPNAVLGKLWDYLPIKKDFQIVEKDGGMFYVVMDHHFLITQKIRGVHTVICSMIENRFGKRIKNALVDGFDWKGLSHALRATYQLQDIYTEGDIVFPFTGDRRRFLLDVKTGQVPGEQVVEIIDERIEYVTQLSEQSDYPEKIPRTLWEDVLVEIILEKTKR